MHNEVRKERSKYHSIIFNSFTKIITVSDYIKEKASAYFPIEKIQTVHNGINLKIFPRKRSSITRHDMGFTDDDFVMVYSGRINKEKGVSELIDAMLQLTDYPQIKLMIIGGSFFGNTNDEDEFIRSLKEKARRIKDNIVFTGFIPYDKMPEYLQLSDIAVVPSMWEEPFGLTVVEAMAAGLPLITTRCGGIPEICEGVATIVGRENIVDSLSTAILDLYGHPEKQKVMSDASKKRSQLFSKERYAHEFFEKLVESST